MSAASLGVTATTILHAAKLHGFFDMRWLLPCLPLSLQHPAGLLAAVLSMRGRLPPAVLQQIEERVGEEPDGDWSLSSLAGLVHLSPYHFARQFKETTGKTVHEYVLEHRLRRSYELLLATDLPIGRIANDAGFADQSHFVRRFRAHFGLTPGAVRKGSR